MNRHSMPSIARSLEQQGHTITERWWEYEEDVNHPVGPPDDYLENRAVADFIGVCKADAIVVFNSSKSEGKAVEQGIAVAQMKPVIVIGERTNLFHYLPSTHIVPDVEGAIAILK